LLENRNCDFQMSLQPSATFATQPYLHFPSLKSNSDGRTPIHSLEKTHLSKNDVIRLVMDKDKPVFPVKAKFETGRPQAVASPSISSSTLLKRKRDAIDERGVEEEVARNVSKILSATRAAQNAMPTSNLKNTSSDPSWANLKSSSPSPKMLYCDTCSKAFPSPKSLRSHSCITPTDGITSTTTLKATLNLSQILQTPSTPLEINGYDSTEIPSNLITPDVSSYESSPPSETASMDDWNGVGLDGKIDDSIEKGLTSVSNPIKTMADNKWCPDCGKVLCSTTTLKRHRAVCKPSFIKEEPSTTLDPLPKWAENKSQSWLQLSVGEHLKAKHLGLALTLRNEMKEEKGSIGVAPVTPAVAPVNANEETLNITSTTRIEKEAKIGSNQFECTVCYKTFSCRKNVRRHMMAIHKVAPPPGAPLNATPRPLSGNFNRATISRSSEESIDGDEKYEDGTEVKTEEMGEESAVPPPNVSQPVPQNIVPPETVKKENGVGSERDQVMGEKRKLPKNENRVERETPLDFGSPIANKKIRMDAIR
ncbi:hypothetical protein PMAYCL1PPCAC_06820, partial [Pristionchus mayeri]